MKELILYYFPQCPYCKKVLNFIEKNNLNNSFILKNIREDPEARKELISIGGKEQVPCLFIDGNPLYESADIINWLEENLL
ncbi:MAG TPA: glutaredoxin [Halanaerobiaceae bacterium]|nr:glutaredoxin [Bacillota bacterium]HHU92987.1 glutaredoxin [Halanaerobiaceae bacterium]HOA40999.1 glutaredoxin [Halanaerobiales bacterium]HPZ63162.1 glutaredoxin [Halanaerobiales bacterium]HQD04376.1 glutaredoxin [Halanaerobiales bacterium]